MTNRNINSYNWTSSDATPRFDDVMHCPHCGDEYVHLTHSILFSGDVKGEDRKLVTTRSDGGLERSTGYPFTPDDERHTFALVGFCENGCEFVVSFVQHKGQTNVHTHHRNLPEARFPRLGY